MKKVLLLKQIRLLLLLYCRPAQSLRGEHSLRLFLCFALCALSASAGDRFIRFPYLVVVVARYNLYGPGPA